MRDSVFLREWSEATPDACKVLRKRALSETERRFADMLRQTTSVRVDELRDGLRIATEQHVGTVQLGTLRVAIAHSPSASALYVLKDANAPSGFRGVSVDLGAALAKKLGVNVVYLPYLASGEIVERRRRRAADELRRVVAARLADRPRSLKPIFKGGARNPAFPPRKEKAAPVSRSGPIGSSKVERQMSSPSVPLTEPFTS